MAISQLLSKGDIIQFFDPEPPSETTSNVLRGIGMLLGVLAGGLCWALWEPGEGGMVVLLCAAMMGGFGALLFYAGHWSISQALRLDVRRRTIVLETLSSGEITTRREVSFGEVRGIFTEGGSVDENVSDSSETLVLNITDQKPIRVVVRYPFSRDMQAQLLRAIKDQPAPPAITDIGSFGKRAAWELKERRA